jgi:hypothetical protein
MRFKKEHHERKKRARNRARDILQFIFIAVLLSLSPAFADIYHWTDEKGVLHITDDKQNVPEEFRDEVNVIKTLPEEEPVVEPPAPPAPPVTPGPPGEEEELYGGQTLQWWNLQFHNLKKRIETVETDFYQKKRFIEVFERGRRYGQIFETNEIYLYERYKKEIPWDEETLEELREELDELRGGARSAGVPREVRE